MVQILTSYTYISLSYKLRDTGICQNVDLSRTLAYQVHALSLALSSRAADGSLCLQTVYSYSQHYDFFK